MVNHIVIIFSLFFSSTATADNDPQHPILSEYSATGLTQKELISRKAAVKVSDGKGHGSGSLVKFNDKYLVLTAYHVVDGKLGDRYDINSPDGETRSGILVYKDEDRDIAFLLTHKFKTRIAADYKPTQIIPNVGCDILYSGFPSDYDLITAKGKVMGYQKNSHGENIIIAQIFGWFGSSGSAVYNEEGIVVGIISGIGSEHKPMPSILENVIWITPTISIDHDILSKNIKEFKRKKK